jgi:hypothetical protein
VPRFSVAFVRYRGGNNKNVALINFLIMKISSFSLPHDISVKFHFHSFLIKIATDYDTEMK